jgi:pyruvate formate lyase activating enzyme
MYARPVAAIGRPMEVLDESKIAGSAIRLPLAGHNDSDAEIDAECAWIAEHLGRDVPLHLTA